MMFFEMCVNEKLCRKQHAALSPLTSLILYPYVSSDRVFSLLIGVSFFFS